MMKECNVTCEDARVKVLSREYFTKDDILKHISVYCMKYDQVNICGDYCLDWG